MRKISQRTWQIIQDLRGARPVEKTPEQIQQDAEQRLADMRYVEDAVSFSNPEKFGLSPRRDQEDAA